MSSQLNPEIELTPCPKCGISGIHACTGQPIVWTPKKVLEFHSVLSEIFGQEPTAVGEKPTESAAD